MWKDLFNLIEIDIGIFGPYWGLTWKDLSNFIEIDIDIATLLRSNV